MTPTIVPLQVTAAPTKNWVFLFFNIWLIWVRKRETPKDSQQSKQTWTGKRWLLHTQLTKVRSSEEYRSKLPRHETNRLRKAMGKKNMNLQRRPS